ncbi:probable tRNA methyltransferase 9B [Engraulis encrasicolus]|uniref:probable tRNA methyltransferase 9B n=1 Tax=Engraulis encrasicolus TaxID=184585 RepID=UPI002FD57D94
MEEAACQLERDHVHRVYEEIAPFFSDSRYKAWPKVRQFLLDQEPGSIVADVGCGNGKYLHINGSVFKLGCDVCQPLVQSASNQGHEVLLCNSLNLPYRDGCFDAILCIAVIHHLSTKERRIQAVREMSRTLRAGGRMMIYVWAMEQRNRKFDKQDLLVPWAWDHHRPPSNPNHDDQAITRNGTEDERLHQQDSRGSYYRPTTCSSGFGKSDKNRRMKSTSSTLDKEHSHRPTTSYPKSPAPRLWIFSRSLDSVLDLGILAVSRSGSPPPPPIESRDRGGVVSATTNSNRNRKETFIRQVSSLFLKHNMEEEGEEDVFVSISNPCVVVDQRPKGKNNNNDDDHHCAPLTKPAAAILAQDCSSMPLPDLVSYQNETLSEGGGGNDVRNHSQNNNRDDRQQDLKHEMTSAETTCSESGENRRLMRYYHVFRQGELTELIENHLKDLRVLETCLDHANWCVVVEKV